LVGAIVAPSGPKVSVWITGREDGRSNMAAECTCWDKDTNIGCPLHDADLISKRSKKMVKLQAVITYEIELNEFESCTHEEDTLRDILSQDDAIKEVTVDVEIV
jgi:hypothetical protein